MTPVDIGNAGFCDGIYLDAKGYIFEIMGSQGWWRDLRDSDLDTVTFPIVELVESGDGSIESYLGEVAS